MPNEECDATRPDENRRLLDVDLRHAIVAQALGELGPDAVAVHEVALGSISRVDVVVVSSTLHAYEIKSDADSLRRLPLQVSSISSAFPFATLLCTERHVERVLTYLPSWWGIVVSRTVGHCILCVEHRPAQPNPSIDPMAASRLIWRTDALQLLERHQLDHGLWSATRPVLWDRIADQLSIAEIVAGMRASFFRRALREAVGASS